MPKIFENLATWAQLVGMKANTVAQVDGIFLASNRPHQNAIFRQIIEEALSLIREHDAHRHARIVQHLQWICNAYLVPPADGMFCRGNRACVINFRRLPGFDNNLIAAIYAVILVHESTHAVIESRGIPYRDENRARIERLCFAEQNRFAARLSAADPMKYPTRILQIKFDERLYRKKGFSWLSLVASMVEAEPHHAADGSQPFSSGPTREPFSAGSHR